MRVPPCPHIDLDKSSCGTIVKGGQRWQQDWILKHLSNVVHLQCQVHPEWKGFKFVRKGFQKQARTLCSRQWWRKVGKSRLSVISTNLRFSLPDHLTLASSSYPVIIHSVGYTLMIGSFDFVLQPYHHLMTRWHTNKLTPMGKPRIDKSYFAWAECQSHL